MPDDLKAARHDLSALRIDREGRRSPGGRSFMVILALVTLIPVGYLTWRKLAPVSRLPRVETAAVRRIAPGAGSAVLSASGYILPERKANVGSKSFGRLEWIGVDIGSAVTKGQVIARLANADLAARVEEAKASLSEAERELARLKRVVEEGIEPRERLDRAGTAIQLAAARLKSAEAELEYTQVRAPFDGIVVRKPAEVGETVGPSGGSGAGSTGGWICTIVDPASLEMVADVNETNIAKIRTGQAVEIVADARPDHKYRGEVRQVVPTADRQKGIVQVKVRLLDPDAALLSEMAARATFLREGTPAGTPPRVIAPRSALRERDGRKFVLLVEGARVRSQDVVTGGETKEGVEITAGLSGGESLIVGGDPAGPGDEVRQED